MFRYEIGLAVGSASGTCLAQKLDYLDAHTPSCHALDWCSQKCNDDLVSGSQNDCGTRHFHRSSYANRGCNGIPAIDLCSPKSAAAEQNLVNSWVAALQDASPNGNINVCVLDIPFVDKNGIEEICALEDTIEDGANFLDEEVVTLFSSTERSSGSSSGDGGSEVCFHASSQVQLSNGSFKRMEHLSVGDKIASVDEKGHLTSVDVVYLPHLQNNREATFLKITCMPSNRKETSIQVTSRHFLFASGSDSEAFVDSVALPASQVREHHWLWVLDIAQNIMKPCSITGIKEIQDKGIYSAYTTNGRLLVDGVAASSYASRPAGVIDFSHDAAHYGMFLYRFAYQISASNSHWFRTLVDSILVPMFT